MLADFPFFVITVSPYSTGVISDVYAGDQVEFQFWAKTSDLNGKLTLIVENNGYEMPTKREVFNVGSNWAFYRYVLRNQLPISSLQLRLSSGERDTPSHLNQTIQFQDFSVYVHRDQSTRVEFGINAGSPHRGGVTFDILSAPNLPTTLTTQVLGFHGTLSPPSGLQPLGGVVTLTATPEPGYRVKAWVGTNDDQSTDQSNQVKMLGNQNVAVSFELAADSNQDFRTDIFDFSDLSEEWKQTPVLADFNRDGSIGVPDIELLSSGWLKHNSFWDLDSQWSEVSNPNGQWEYRSNIALLSTHQTSWLPGDLGANQPAWANGAGTIPGWYLSTGLGLWDVPAGTVACHSPAVIRWRSPIAGQIQIFGSCWLTRDLGRTLQVKLKHNGAVFTSSIITRGSGTSGNSFSFSQMSAGPNGLTRNVQIGDTIEFQTNANTGSNEDFLAVKMSIFND